MPVPLAPYPTPPATLLAPAYTPPSPANGSTGGQSQLVCSGCRNLLMYPVGATSVCCAVCNAVTAVPPPGTEMAQLVCGGCHTLLMYIRGATSVQCSCCHTVNLALEGLHLIYKHFHTCILMFMLIRSRINFSLEFWLRNMRNQNQYQMYPLFFFHYHPLYRFNPSGNIVKQTMGYKFLSFCESYLV